MQTEEEIFNAIDIATSATKKRPGRPKKKILNVPIEHHGIVPAPVNDEDFLELVYTNPSLFKKILQLHKQYGVSEIDMLFDKDGVKTAVKDHLGKSTIYSIIDGKCMNLYHCKAPMRVCVNRDSLEKVFSTLGKNHYKITFILKENFRSIMYLIVKDLEYNNDEAFEIDIIYKPEDTACFNANDNDANYPIKFKLSSKHFKSRIGQIRKFSRTLTVQKIGLGPLQFTSDSEKKVKWTATYNDSDKIELKSTIDADDIFNVSVYIDHIRPFCVANVGDDVFISADKQEKISFTIQLDERKDIGWACVIKIYTEIKDYRKNLTLA